MSFLRLLALAVLAAAVFALSAGVAEATPTPSPTPAQTPTFPSAVFTFVNNTGQVVNGLEIEALSGGASLEQNAPGCPVPAVAWSPPGGGVVAWSQLCVDPGEIVKLRIFNDCFDPCGAPSIFAYAWTINGTPLTITPTPTPAPTANPAAVGGATELIVRDDALPIPLIALVAAGDGVVAVMVAGLWYGRRRWLR
jgi:hypothetical protein